MRRMLPGTSVVFALFLACGHQDQATQLARNPASHKTRSNIQLAQAGEPPAVDLPALENMKLAMLAFFGSVAAEFPPGYLELQRQFGEELKSSAVWMSNGIGHVGAWRLERHDNQLMLARYPPPSETTAYIFRATLQATDATESGWTVVSFAHETEFGPGNTDAPTTNH
ncbi:MAG: hypothetical protein KBG15_13660 [Kofleriaceae bacterium]|nr:hypothetical protein [Kofleriaceae bacterium]